MNFPLDINFDFFAFLVYHFLSVFFGLCIYSEFEPNVYYMVLLGAIMVKDV